MRIKQDPEDFIVKEIFRPNNLPGFFVYELSKKNFSTPLAVKLIEEKFNCKIKFSGNKDKKAITYQFISCKKKIPEFNYEKENSWIKTKFLGTNSEPLCLGSHSGNKFEIKIYDLEKEAFELKEFYFPNYFGEQRFSKNNVEVGNLMLERKFEEALKIIEDNKANEYLKNKPKDFVGAIKKIPKTILRIYLTAVQSYEFNKELSERISGEKIIVANQKLNFPKKEIKSSEKISMKGWDSGDRRFLFREYPELSLEGDERNAFVKAEEISFDGKVIKFDLPKSAYATIFLRSIFLEDIKY